MVIAATGLPHHSNLQPDFRVKGCCVDYLIDECRRVDDCARSRKKLDAIGAWIWIGTYHVQVQYRRNCFSSSYHISDIMVRTFQTLLLAAEPNEADCAVEFKIRQYLRKGDDAGGA
jgi:hypothetical protein